MHRVFLSTLVTLLLCVHSVLGQDYEAYLQEYIEENEHIGIEDHWPELGLSEPEVPISLEQSLPYSDSTTPIISGTPALTEADWNRSSEFLYDKEQEEMVAPTTPRPPPKADAIVQDINMFLNHVANFERLDCNSNLARTQCVHWSTQPFGTQTNHSAAIRIECGTCVILDSKAPASIKAPGLDILGKLIIPNRKKITFEVKFVRVQGLLEITSRKETDGTPDVKFFMTGTDPAETQFVPHDNNKANCGGTDSNPSSCSAGFKAITVAGGRVTLRGLPQDTEAWVPLHDTVDDEGETGPIPSKSLGLVVSSAGVRGKWGIGSEVLVTSHTYMWNEEQVRKITGIRDYSSSDYVVLELDEEIDHPTTQLESMDYAVEVGLLSRNILFEAEEENDQGEDAVKFGGHFIVYRTQMEVQHIEGIEVRNFGQQGTLGRYPIHFHVCGDVTGSKVIKNLVRKSNQRCYVVHASDYLLVEGNVAYDTHGHCFMTEDGMEIGNIFRRNLGARTKIPTHVIPDNPDANNGMESDRVASTFWMVNANNTMVKNVAAGSQSTGFWLELRNNVRGKYASDFPGVKPKFGILGVWDGNVAHSNSAIGFRTYPSGFIPPEGATFRNHRAYRNWGKGWFSHNSKGLVLEGALFADNRMAIDFDRADDMTLKNSQIIGVSPEYRDLHASQNVRRFCVTRDPARVIRGVELHSHRRYLGTNGAVIDNVDFSGFLDSGCDDGRIQLFTIDSSNGPGAFDYFTILRNNKIENGAEPMSFCAAYEAGFQDVYITDYDRTMSPAGTATGSGTSTFISNTTLMRTFVTHGNCQFNPQGCYDYCVNTCFGSINFAISPKNTEDVKLQVCSTTEASKCATIDPWPSSPGLNEQNPSSTQRRFFTVSVPGGSKYEAKFVDGSGSVVWPSFVQKTYEDRMCHEAPRKEDIALTFPDVTEAHCDNLIRNGEITGGSDHWVFSTGGLQVATGQGIGKTDALKDTSSMRQTDSIGQFLDIRCLRLHQGASFLLQAWVRRETRGAQEVRLCDPARQSCPRAGIYLQTGTNGRTITPVGNLVHGGEVRDGFQLLEGVLTITEEMAGAETVFFFIERHQRGSGPHDYAFLIDDVAITYLSSGETTCGTDLVRNGDFRISHLHWERDGTGVIEMFTPGVDGADDAALTLVGQGGTATLNPECFKENKRYAAHAMFRQRHTTSGVPVTPDNYPAIYLRVDGGESQAVALTTGLLDVDGWNHFYGEFVADSSFVNANDIKLYFRKAGTYDMIIDNVSIKEVVTDCSELIVNGNFETGPRPLWIGSKLTGAPGYGGGYALRSSERPNSNGPRYLAGTYTDFSCYAEAPTFKISARIRLHERGTDNPGTCDLNAQNSLSGDACPELVITETDLQGENYVTRARAYPNSIWDADSFNLFEFEFTPQVSGEETADLLFWWMGFSRGVDIVIDDMSMMPMRTKYYDIVCTNSGRDTVYVVVKEGEQPKTKRCRQVRKKPSVFCQMEDLTKSHKPKNVPVRPYVYEICQKQCESYHSGCPSTAS